MARTLAQGNYWSKAELICHGGNAEVAPYH